jgi:hypothetical protein
MKKSEDMSEAYFRHNIIDPWLKANSPYWIPTTGLLCRNGVPDYMAHIGEKVVYIEAKDMKGKLSGYQLNEIAKIHKAGLYVQVVHPGNWQKQQRRILNHCLPGLEEVDLSHLNGNKTWIIMNREGSC